jgi:uncharacterized protein
MPRKRIALTMRLDEQPGETNARRGNGGGAREQARPVAKPAQPRGRDAQPAGNSGTGALKSGPTTQPLRLSTL